MKSGAKTFKKMKKNFIFFTSGKGGNYVWLHLFKRWKKWKRWKLCLAPPFQKVENISKFLN
jgi:hypothetical protein